MKQSDIGDQDTELEKLPHTDVVSISVEKYLEKADGNIAPAELLEEHDVRGRDVDLGERKHRGHGDCGLEVGEVDSTEGDERIDRGKEDAVEGWYRG